MVHDRRALGAAAVLGAAAAGLWFAPPASWLVRFSPDGALQPAVAQFLDRAWWIGAGAALVCLIAALVPGAATALGGAVGPASTSASGRHAALAIGCIAILAAAARVVVGEIGDAGLGDDGARNVWLMRWLADPHFIRGGLWAPGHLYLQALLWLPLQNVMRAGELLSALATAGTIAILGLSALRNWGTTAGVSGALLAAVLPVSMAFGSVSDVNPLFAFAMVAAVAAAGRARRDPRWLAASWLGMASAAWCRFEAFLLIPAVLVPLWPRWRTMLWFGVACTVPTLAWHALNYFDSGDALRVFNAVQSDPTLQSSRFSTLFDLFGAAWKSITLPVAVLGACGMARALRSRRGREWMPLAFLHAAALGAATVEAGTGNQARYLILVAAILSQYAGVAIGGIARISRAWSVLAFGATAALAMWLPSLHPDRQGLWICRDVRLRGIVDCIAAAGIDGPLIWVADEAAYFYPCRTGFPIEHYDAVSRADSDAGAIVDQLRDASQVWLCARDNATSQSWLQPFRDAFRDAPEGTWMDPGPVARCSDYTLFHLFRIIPALPSAPTQGTP